MAHEYYNIHQSGSKEYRINNYSNKYIHNHRTTINLPEPKRSFKSGGYYLSAIGKGTGFLGKLGYNIGSFGVLKGLLILLIVANFVRLLTDDSNYLSMGSMLNQLSQIKTIPTGWLNTLSYSIRNKLIGSSDSIVAKNWAQAVVALLLPLPTILYLLIGLLNILWWLMSVLSIFFGNVFI